MAEPSAKKPWIETPLIWSRPLSKAAGCNIYLKLENTQPSGSFKSRGIGNFMQSRLPKTTAKDCATHFFCSSGGNAGLACVHAAVTLGHPATIVVPLSTSSYMISKIREAGAHEVIQIGTSWYEADQHLNNTILLEARAAGVNAVYVPPFEDPDIWSGNATMIPEIMHQLPEVEKHYPVVHPQGGQLVPPDVIICSVGGGGLFNGIMQGLLAFPNKTKVLAVETSGADSLAQAVQAGSLITLPAITSIATTLGARTVSKRAFSLAMEHDDRVKTVVLSDRDAVNACVRFGDDERILVEPSCGVSLAVCYQPGKLKELIPELEPWSNVVVCVCGGSGVSMEILRTYVSEMGLI